VSKVRWSAAESLSSGAYCPPTCLLLWVSTPENVRTSLVLHNSKYEAAVPLELKVLE